MSLSNAVGSPDQELKHDIATNSTQISLNFKTSKVLDSKMETDLAGDEQEVFSVTTSNHHLIKFSLSDCNEPEIKEVFTKCREIISISLKINILKANYNVKNKIAFFGTECQE